MITPRPQPAESEMTEKIVVKNESTRVGSIGISECGVKKERERERERKIMLLIYFLVEECAASGRYISLVNPSMNKAIDVSGWMLKRRIDSAAELLYIIPKGVQLQPGTELIIYSKLGANAVESSSDHPAVSSLLHQEIVTSDVASWGM